MSIDHYFDRSIDRAVMRIGDARAQLCFSVAILGALHYACRFLRAGDFCVAEWKYEVAACVRQPELR